MSNSTIIEIARSFQVELYNLKEDNDRSLSWVHCYRTFYDYFHRDTLNDEDYDYLALHLGFYLASWGMYRASSFILQRDYKIHVEVVKILFNYKELQGITCEELLKPNNHKKLSKLSVSISDSYLVHYKKVRNEQKKSSRANTVSDTLITKVLMGTLGCSPAYDRHFKAGLKKLEINPYSFNCKAESLKPLIAFYKENENVLEPIRNSNTNIYFHDNIEYPQMKLLDLIFWTYGNPDIAKIE